MAKIIRTLKIEKDLDEWFIEDSKDVYGKDRYVSTHMVNILKKYKETRDKK